MKHKMWSRLLSMALAVMMIVSIVPNSAFAEAANEITSTSQVQEIPAEETQTPEEVTVPEAETPAEPSTEPAPTEEPVAEPTAEPTVEPTAEPTQAPAETAVPSEQPSAEPTAAPEATETPNASAQPSETPAASATPAPSESPVPSENPAPSESPVPSETPEPTETPEVTEEPVVLNEKEYTVSAETSDGVKVEVTVPAETLPEGAEMKVDRLAEGSEGYAQAQDALSETGADGFAALDIRFELNGEEVEPAQKVQVKVSAENLLPEEADSRTVVVQHLQENEDNAVTLETVAMAAEMQANQVPQVMAVTNEATNDTQSDVGSVAVAEDTLTAEFSVESFSTFTITWVSGWREKSISIECYDYKTKELLNTRPASIEAQNYDIVKFSTIEIDGYKFEEAYIDDTPVSAIRARNDWSWFEGYKWTVEYQKVGDDDWWNLNDRQIKVYYVKLADLDTVKTVDSASKGVNISLFNYDQSNINDATRSIFKFGGGSSGGYEWNQWDPGKGVYQGIVEDKLTTVGNVKVPAFAKTQIKGQRNLAYLFTGNQYATAYTGLNHLFLKSVYDETGYYEYDAGSNFATIKDDLNDKDFKVYNQPYKPNDTAAATPKFLPFNELNGNANSLKGGTDYLFGMSVDFTFYQPKDGIARFTTSDGVTKTDQMKFEFTGDDDVWVFIDDVLVLDMGGIHDAMTGSINFATGAVEVNKVGNDNNNSQHTTLEKIMRDAKGGAWVAENMVMTEEGNFIFKDYTNHTFNYYYLERGAGGSNCRIRFNLQTIPKNSLDVTKNLQKTDNTELDDYLQKTMTYRFQVLNIDGTSRLEEGDIYTILNGSTPVTQGTVEEQGIFTLKAGQTARFSGKFPADSESYFVRELIPDGATGQYGDIIYNVSGKGGSAQIKDDVGNVGDIEFNGYDTSEISPADGSATVVYTNNVTTDTKKWSMLKITKELTAGQQPVPGDTFRMYVTLNDEPLAVGTQYTVTGQDDPKTVKEKGMIELQAGESATLPVLADVTFQVTEETLSPAYSFDQYEYSDADAEKPVDKVETDQEKGISGYVNTAGNFEVTVTNSRNYGDVTITKTIVNNANLTKQQLKNITSNLTFTLKKGAESVKTVSGNELSWEDDLAGNLFSTYTFYNVENGDYTVTESVGDTVLENVVLTVKINSAETTAGIDGYTSESKTLTAPGSVVFNFENTYELGNGTLQINKNLIDEKDEPFGGYGKGKDVFSFQIKADTGIDKGKVWYMQVDGDGTAYYGEENGKKLTSLTLPSGEYTVTELDNINYQFAGVISSDSDPLLVGKSITVKVGGDVPTTVTFTNRAKDTGMTDGSGVINQFKKENGEITFDKIWIANDDDEPSLSQQGGNQ